MEYTPNDRSIKTGRCDHVTGWIRITRILSDSKLYALKLSGTCLVRNNFVIGHACGTLEHYTIHGPQKPSHEVC